MAFIDGKGLVGQAKVFATEREAELDSRLVTANETIKRLAEAVKRLVWAADNCIGAHGIESGSIVDASEYGRAALALVPKEKP